MTKGTDIKEAVRERYAAAAQQVEKAAPASCCGPSASECCGSTDTEKDIISRDLYTIDEMVELPEAAVLASLGCGNPTALAELKPGETVLDLGSGGGIDVLLSARRVGETGKAYGVDMTDEMLELARRNREEAGIGNAEFLKGSIEDIPLPDNSVDVVISNCVINLSTDKDRVLREAYRVLRPGGRFAVSDIVIQGVLPEELRKNLEAWAGCVAGALHEDEYRGKLAEAGFVDIDVEVTRAYEEEEMLQLARDLGVPVKESWLEEGRICSAFVRARRPE
ncbi:MAG: arsenite S-adenosylmethyltransferase [Gemmatimonas sp. SG8_38_2]|nr:MAG: arsenite S-adenosylmethyltransferase [Gemmatimonas sp. SG8_38_2]